MWQLKAELQYTVHTSKQQQLKHLKVRMLTEGWMNWPQRCTIVIFTVPLECRPIWFNHYLSHSAPSHLLHQSWLSRYCVSGPQDIGVALAITILCQMRRKVDVPPVIFTSQPPQYRELCDTAESVWNEMVLLWRILNALVWVPVCLCHHDNSCHSFVSSQTRQWVTKSWLGNDSNGVVIVQTTNRSGIRLAMHPYYVHTHNTLEMTTRDIIRH